MLDLIRLILGLIDSVRTQYSALLTRAIRNLLAELILSNPRAAHLRWVALETSDRAFGISPPNR